MGFGIVFCQRSRCGIGAITNKPGAMESPERSLLSAREAPRGKLKKLKCPEGSLLSARTINSEHGHAVGDGMQMVSIQLLR